MSEETYKCGDRFKMKPEYGNSEVMLCQTGYYIYQLINVVSGNRYSDIKLKTRRFDTITRSELEYLFEEQGDKFEGVNNNFNKEELVAFDEMEEGRYYKCHSGKFPNDIFFKVGDNVFRGVEVEGIVKMYAEDEKFKEIDLTSEG